MSSDISEYWRAHPKYWIALGETQAKADAEIYELFAPARLETFRWIDQVIYLDQFMRHFQRAAPDQIREDAVGLARVRAAEIVISHKSELAHVDEFELVFCLMPFKHIGDFDFLFTAIHHHWLPAHGHMIPPILMKFYTDSYSKYYSCIENVYKDVICYDAVATVRPTYDSARICDSYPHKYSSGCGDWETQSIPDCAIPLIESLLSHVPPLRPMIVSLSGGVDSMVMCYLLKCAGVPVMAAHIVYGNRDVSEDELAFLRSYCERLEVPLYAYRIEWLRRGQVDREFYESMTRTLRFLFYKCVGGETPHVALGHIQDDLIENIWTNFAHATHLSNLVKMRAEEHMDGVILHRPWLGIKKTGVYAVAEALGIPYLKNTTPSWSNRGKFRETFYAATHAQFGASVDEKVLESASALAKQAALIERLLFKPVYDSWNHETRMLDITRAVEAGLDGDGWSQIFTTICHTKLGISKPSIHACRDFGTRVHRPGGLVEGQRLSMKKDLVVVFHPDDERKVLQFIT
jgi:tRNA(Ile)-lysidine synthetase-like protein